MLLLSIWQIAISLAPNKYLWAHTHTHRIHIKFYQPNTRRKVAKYKFLCGYMRILHRIYNTLNTYTEFITHSTHTQNTTTRKTYKYIYIEREGGGGEGEGKGESYQMVCAGSRLSLDWRLWVVLWNSWRNPFVKISYSFLILSVKKTTFSQLKHVATNPYHPFSSLFFSYSRIHHTHMCSTQLLKARRRYTVRGKGNFVI